MENKFSTRDYSISLSKSDSTKIKVTDKFGDIKEISVDEFNGMLCMLFEVNEIDD